MTDEARAGEPQPSTEAGERLYLHIVAPDEYGWPTDDQLRAAIRAVEEEAGRSKPGPFSKLVRSGKAFFERETARLTAWARHLDAKRVARAVRRRVGKVLR